MPPFTTLLPKAAAAAATGSATTTTTTTTTTSAKSAVLLLGWMDGKYKNVEKYASFYLERGHPVVLGLSTWKNVFLGGGKQVAADAAPALEAAGALDPKKGGTIVHAFSNGGVVTLDQILKHLPETTTPSRTLALRALILDSAPGRPTVTSAVNAMTVSIRSTIARAVARAVVRAVFYAWIAVRWMCVALRIPVEPLVVAEAARKVLGLPKGGGRGSTRPEAAAVPFTKAPKLFLYSREDALVLSEHVEEYIERAKEAEAAVAAAEKEQAGSGVVSRVHAKRFDGSGHVRHAVDFPKEYWGAVDAFLKTVD
ncbi:hypothetical protein DFJ73DRAFT_797033 [Zopfochytrium polystomum]|nr:hypothetical protein DFJ73DRAFT_797033 [Zopfochytrium polystomum]